MVQTFLRFSLLLTFLFSISSSKAASGTWLNPSGGSWTNAANWNNGIIADGSGNNANFANLSLPADATVTVELPRTLGSLTFDDQNAVKHTWSLNPGIAGSLILAGAKPTVTVNSATAGLNVAISGTAGLTKLGAGTLALNLPPVYSGTTTVSAGTLRFAGATLSAENPLLVSAASLAGAFGTVNLAVNTSATAIDLSGAGTLKLSSTTNGPLSPDLYFGPNHSGNTCWGARLALNLDLGDSQRFVFGKTGHNGVGPYGLTGADCQFAGTISGAGGLTFIAQNNWTASGPMEVPFALNASNTFTGPVEIQRGSVYLGNPNALNRGNTLTFSPVAGNNARLFLYGNNAVVTDLSSPGAGTSLIANGNLKNGATVTLAGITLEVIQNHDATFNGSLLDVFAEYTGSGSGTTGPLNLLKNGSATLKLTGNHAYSGTTTIAGGTLQIEASLGNTSVTVQPGARLTGSGTCEGPVTILPVGTLAPGGPGIGSLTINNALTLAGTIWMKVEKAGTALNRDQVAGLGTLTYGGSLLVTNIGDIRTGALSAGDSFTLFTATAYAGAFTNISLPPLSAGLAWDTSNLWVNGSIAVVDPAAAPVLTAQPQSLTVAQSSSASFNAVAAGSRPLAFQWQKDGQSLSGATATTYTLASAGTNDSASYRVIITNSFGSTTSSVAVLTVLPAGSPAITNGLFAYLNFDNNLNGQAGTTVNGTLYTGGAANGPRYKPGVAGFAAAFANTATAGQPDDWAVSLGNLEKVYSNSFSVSLWERTTTSGDGALVGNKDWTSGANVGWVISSLDPKNLNYNAVGGTRRDIDLNPPFSDGAWHLVTLTFDRPANQVISYIDGVAVSTSDISPAGNASLNAGFNTLVGSSGNGTYSGAADIDELAMWSRVLAPAEISGLYAVGLKGLPLTAAVPGEPPAITAQPLDLNVAAGGSANFTVTVGGPGTYTYQWRYNGANLAGATNATLTLSSVTSASQGVYTVLVSNGAGAVLSSGAVLSVYNLAVTGQWDFEQGDLRATVGAGLEYLADTTASFPYLDINGQMARVLAFAASSTNQGFCLRHGAKPNGGGKFVNQYTLVMDVMFPTASSSHFRALFQTDPFNHAGNDAEFFVGDAGALPGANGIGAESQFNGSLAPDTWYRIAFAVDLAAPAGQQLATYINGVQVGTQSLPGGIDGRYALGPTALLFTSGLAGRTQPGFVNSIQFVNGWLAPAAIAALGGPITSGLPPGNSALQITSISNNASLLTLHWTGPDGQFRLQSATNVDTPAWQDLGAPSTNRTFSVPVSPGTAFYRVVESQPDFVVGQLSASEQSLPSQQILRSAGRQLQFGGRPVDLALSPDGRTVFIKNLNNLVVVDSASWRILQTLNYPGSGASMHGIAVSPTGTRVYVTGSGNELYEWTVATNGLASFARTISLPGGSNPCGLALSADGSTAYVCLSIANTLAQVNLASGTVRRQINVGIAPWDVVLSPDGATAYISDWGGRFPQPGELSATSAGTAVVIDQRGVAASGVLSCVNLVTGLETAQIPTGLHPSDLELSPDGGILFVANANSDTVTVIDTLSRTVKETVLVRPDPSFPYGSAADGLALSKDARCLFVASAGNNAIAILELPNAQHTNTVLQGFLPVDWYPGAIVADSNCLYAVNVKGLGSRQGQPATTSWQIGAFLGTANKVPLPTEDALAKFSAQAFDFARVPQIKQTQLLLRPGQPPVPVPARVGEPSVFQHVVYILKENKTYDQVLGDLPQGNGDPSLCVYPRFVSPNHHALAEQYVLLDNFYCNGVNSADGHSWATEANNTDHLEKSFGGFNRSYTFGDDPLTYSSSGFIWNNVLQHGLTFRNYGEFDYAAPVPASASWFQIYSDFTNGTRSIRYAQNIGVASLRPYSSTNVPGWNLGIPDVVRADGFIRELNAAQAAGSWAAFHFLYLPNDHTGGPPSPQAQVADNDLALGQVVEAITRSAFASNTVIFVVEDDPQSGYDHVDGHRSLCLVISPFTRRGQVVSRFYNQAGVLHTIEQILGLPPMNQQDALAPLMFDCFTNFPNFTPYTALVNNIPLTQGLASPTATTAKQRYWAAQLRNMDFSKPDLINEDLFNRYTWFTIKGDVPYPAAYAGPHGKGLKRLGLLLDKTRDDD